MRVRALCLLLLLPYWATAANVVGVVSERSAADVVAGAHAFLDQHPDASIQLRTPEQLAELSQAELEAFFARADAVFVLSVFGEHAERMRATLLRVLGERRLPVLAINNTPDLDELTHSNGEFPLRGLPANIRQSLMSHPAAGQSLEEHLQQQLQQHPQQAFWLQGRARFQGRSPAHIADMISWLLGHAGVERPVAAPTRVPPVRYYRAGVSYNDPADLELEAAPVVALLDLDRADRPGDRELLDAQCEAVRQRGTQCVAVLARWGGASLQAVEGLAKALQPARLSAVVSLQFFTVGGGDGRREVTEAFKALDVPVLQGIRLSSRSREQWMLSGEGIPLDQVYYRVAMPELQGISQPSVLAVASPPSTDPRTGIRQVLSKPLPDQVQAMADRLQRWQRLQEADNADKRIAVVYYNHPPGRHNIGADKLDVPASLMQILRSLEQAGYHVGELPADQESLLEAIQHQGVNLPDNADALADMAERVPGLSASEYLEWFSGLPEPIQGEVSNGPLGYLHARLRQAQRSREHAQATRLLEHISADLHHLLESHEHPARERALDLLGQYVEGWQVVLQGAADDVDDQLRQLGDLQQALLRTGIPGLSGWGEAPGRSMVHQDRMLFPGLAFGNVMLMPQPPRGWEVSESLLHANTSFAPTHQYMGFYHWLRDHFQADAIVYVGRHSTLEFLPRRRAGLVNTDDYPALLGGDLPVIYPYIVDGVGEGIQAKRRAMAVMISHLIPPLSATKLYDELLQLRQLVESYESAIEPDSPTRERSAQRLRQQIIDLDLGDVIEREIADDLGIAVEEVRLAEVSESLLVHEAGHYVTHMQEQFMPQGLHVFARDWDDDASNMLLDSMAGDGDIEPEWRRALEASPRAERQALLAALDGRFIAPGRGNDPMRSPDVLPTGRNFHALSSDLIPTRVAWTLGAEMAKQARQRGDAQAEGSEALILWASDTVRDEGVMIAFGLDMLGVRPRWNARGAVDGVERMALGEQRRRRDVLFTTSGLFRDLYEDQLVLLDQAVRVALEGSAEVIRRDYPELIPALDAVLSPLPDELRQSGAEALDVNDVAARWVADVAAMRQQGMPMEQAGKQAVARVFGAAPGAYGTGVARLTERSGAWSERGELADIYRRRMGHSYGMNGSGSPAQAAFSQRLADVGRTYLGRSNHLYGLLDRDDAFDFQGGLSVAVEQQRGSAPDNRVLMHADPDNAYVDSLERALVSELQGRYLNPQWLRPLMDHGYAGARTMTRDFLDNLWGWQATSPDVVRPWVWDAVHEVYFQDRHDLGLETFLQQGPNVHVKTHMQSVMLLVAHRDYWQPETEVLQEMLREFAELVAEHGLPGSGHARADHPTMDWVSEQLAELDVELQQRFDQRREQALEQASEAETDPSRIAEIEPVQQSDPQPASATEAGNATRWLAVSAGVLAVLLLLGGALAGRGAFSKDSP